MDFEEVILPEDQDFMTMGQFLKFVGLIGTGGQAKWFLAEEAVFLNGKLEQRRGKKLVPGDQIKIEGQASYLIKKT